MQSKTDRKMCGTCEYWTGNREPVFDAKGTPKINIYDRFGVCEKQDEIDATIERHSNGWKVARLTRVSRAVIRLCVYEMANVQDVPATVAINEAIELSKKYDDEKARSFVNGVLNGIKAEYDAK